MTGKGYHRLLERQLKKFLPGYPEVPAQWQDFLNAVSNSYSHSDNDRLLMETAMRESSDELMSRKEVLNNLLKRQSHVLESLREAASALFPEQSSLANEDLLQLADVVQEEIQKRRIAESRKAQSDQRLVDIIDSLSLGMARYDLQGKLTHVEHRFAEIFGREPNTMIGLKSTDFSHVPLEAEAGLHPIEFYFNNQVFEAPFSLVDGKIGWLLCTTAPLFDDGGEVEGGVIVVFDITTRKRLEQEMMEARKAAEAGLELRKTILANVSHELRTPVNAIVGMSSLLAGTNLNEEQKNYLKTMRFSSDGLLVLIDDLLDVSRIEAGKVELEEIDFSVHENFSELTKALRLRAEEKGLSFEWQLDERIAPRLLGDAHRLNQIVTNLIGNAIKFTPTGSVRLEITYVGDTNDSQDIRFSVIDTGIGIAAERQTAVFQAFAQEDNSTTRKYGGTGLGLSISKRIVEMMGGELVLNSEKNNGTTFSFQVRLKKAMLAPPKKKEFNPNLEGARILLVEDNKVNQFLANALLKSWNAIVDISEDGEDAVNRMKNEAYDLVLMDLQMPIMDGFEATRCIRQELQSKIPIIGLSANALNGERERSLETGMDDYITKPFQPEALYEKIHGFVFPS
ncbi:MAG: ATP-binding protein [Flavobacteriales bacterium]